MWNITIMEKEETVGTSKLLMYFINLITICNPNHKYPQHGTYGVKQKGRK